MHNSQPPFFPSLAGLVLGLLGGRRRQGNTEKDINIRGDPHVLIVGKKWKK